MKLNFLRLNAVIFLVFSLNIGATFNKGLYSSDIDIQQQVKTPTYKKECIDISKSEKMTLDGKIIVHQPEKSQIPVIFDLNTEKHQPFLDDTTIPAFYFAVSPDGENFSYIRASNSNYDNLSLVTASISTGKRHSIAVDQKENWGGGLITSAAWLTNDLLALGRFRDDHLTDILIFNPAAQTWQGMRSDFPKIVASEKYWMDIWPSVITISPSKNYAVYLAEDHKNSDPGEQSLALWDLKKNKEITRIENYGYTMVNPIWKSDDSGVYLVKNSSHWSWKDNKDEILFLGNDGAIEKITNLADVFKKDYVIDKMILSPDETELAIAMRTNLQNNIIDYTLAIINLATLEMVDFCHKPEDGEIAWSPDSTMLAFPEKAEDGVVATSIIDIKEKKGMILAENSTPLIWIKSSAK